MARPFVETTPGLTPEGILSYHGIITKLPMIVKGV